MHAVDEEDGILVDLGGCGDRALCCREGLGDGRSAVDAAGAGRVPEGARVGVDVLGWVN